MTFRNISLEKGFQTFTEEIWQQVVASSLKNISFEKKLLKETYDGFKLKPLYHDKNLDTQVKNPAFPGAYPYVRGASAGGNLNSSWKIALSYNQRDPKVANKLLQDDIAQGITHFNLYFDRKGQKGIYLVDEKSLDELFEQIDLKSFSWGIHSAENILLTATFFLHYLKKSGRYDKNLKIHFHSDPLQTWAKTGKLPFSSERALSHMSEVSSLLSSDLPLAKTVGVSTSCYHNSGASITQELALALATGVEYIEALKKSGMKIETILNTIQFFFSYDSQIFMSMAKTRAFRFLWARVVESYSNDRELQCAQIFARSSLRMLSLYDPWTNILRTTSATMGAALSDIPVIETFSFDRAINESYNNENSEYFTIARRLSRNISHILSEESYLSKVLDPAGGSYFLEALTLDFNQRAWAIFQDIERQGGMVNCLKSGKIQQWVEETREKRRSKIQKRQDIITGVNNFANPKENFFDKCSPKEEESFHVELKDCDPKLTKNIVEASRNYKPFDLSSKLMGEVLLEAYAKGFSFSKAAQILHSQSEVDRIQSLNKFRSAQAYEDLRQKCELKNIKLRAIVSLIIQGDYAELSSRINFIKNIFETLGLSVEEVLAGSPLSQSKMSEAKINICVLVANNEEYPNLVVDFLSLSTKHDAYAYLAGKMDEELLDSLQEKGIIDNLYSGQNIYQVLENLVHRMEKDYEEN